MKIINNFLPKEYFEELQLLMMGNEFPWFYNDAITSGPDGSPDPGYQFVHSFFKVNEAYYNVDTFHLLHPLLCHLNVRNLYKLKANQNPANGGEQLGRHHVDIDIPNATTSILYVNTNDGYTKFEDGTKVESVKNRALIFNPTLNHCSTNTTDQKRRVNINFNYI